MNNNNLNNHSNILDNSPNNSITVENSNLNNNANNSNNIGQGLFKVHKKSTDNLDNNNGNTLKPEKEQKDKENSEINDKVKAAENIIITNNDEQGIY